MPYSTAGGASRRRICELLRGPFNSFKSARRAVTDGPDVLIDGGLAATTLEFVARLELPEGKIIANRARSALVWRCSKGRWRIVREQNAVREVPHAELEAALQKQEQRRQAEPPLGRR